MKANELRIGNLLNYDTAEGEILPTVIDWQDLKWLTEDPKGFNLVHSPITLTEEWLVKFGFKKDSIISEDDSYSFKGELVFIGETGIRYFGLTTILKYVHQLQNLYFAITGEELTLSE